MLQTNIKFSQRNLKVTDYIIKKRWKVGKSETNNLFIMT